MSELGTAKDARRTTLRLNISTPDNWEGTLTNPSRIILIRYFMFCNLSPNMLIARARVMQPITIPCNKNEKSMPHVPNPVATSISPATNLKIVPIISIIKTFFASEIPSSTNLATKPTLRKIRIPIPIQLNPCKGTGYTLKKK